MHERSRIASREDIEVGRAATVVPTVHASSDFLTNQCDFHDCRFDIRALCLERAIKHIRRLKRARNLEASSEGKLLLRETDFIVSDCLGFLHRLEYRRKSLKSQMLQTIGKPSLGGFLNLMLN